MEEDRNYLEDWKRRALRRWWIAAVFVLIAGIGSCVNWWGDVSAFLASIVAPDIGELRSERGRVAEKDKLISDMRGEIDLLETKLEAAQGQASQRQQEIERALRQAAPAAWGLRTARA